MRHLLALLALSAASVAAQPSTPGERGLYGVLGNAAPERLLLPDGADAVLSAGVRLTEAVDVHVGYGQEGDRRLIGNMNVARRTGAIPYHGTLERQTRALSASVGLRVAAPPFVGEARTSATYDHYDQTRRIQTWSGDGPEAVPVETVRDDRGRFLHAGASASLGVEAARGYGRIRAALGLAALTTTGLSGTLPTPEPRWMAFLRVPTTVALPNARAVTLDVTLALARLSQDRDGAPRLNVSPIVNGAVRVDL